jgi:hypothetical protein
VTGRWLFERRAAQRRANRVAAKRRRKPSASTAQVLASHERRIVLDLNPLTLVEIMDCVSERVNQCRAQGKPVPHMTRVALTMLHEALALPLPPRCPCVSSPHLEWCDGGK